MLMGSIVQEARAQITWYHHVTLMDKITNDLPEDLGKQLPSVEDIQKRIGGSDDE